MLFRVSLILTAVAGIGMIGVTQWLVRPHIKRIVDQREVNKRNWHQEITRADKLAGDLKQTETKLAGSQQALDETGKQLVAARAMADQQEGRADTLAQNLDVTRRELNETQQRFAAWKALEIPVETVRQVIQSEKRLRQETAILREELQVVVAENERLEKLVVAYTTPDEAPLMPGVKGSILAVDPKWNFVVLDVGEKAGAKPHGVFMVSRDGKLIGKVKVATVNVDRSIANVMPGWQFGELMEGDQVIF
ncbi:MAG TPA: hypothetical protein VK615_09885 [Candidatus Binatia bacterium]|nr:hypothetical protein [Candidatus Binatia bacterium]